MLCEYHVGCGGSVVHVLSVTRSVVEVRFARDVDGWSCCK